MLDGMSDLSIRRAHAADAEAIAAIYNQGIEDRVATLETELRTPDERRAWLAARGERHPVLIAERGGAVLAWASLNPFNPRAAYAHVADLSIYVARSARGSGVGRVLLGRIIDEARGLGFHKMVLAAFPRTPPACGSTRGWASPPWGRTASRAASDGCWVDVIVMEQILG